MKNRTLALRFVIGSALFAAAARADDKAADDAIHQIAPLAALTAGVYEGPTRFGDALRRGDFGLGGLSPLEGEVIVLDGVAWHAAHSGRLRRVAPAEQTPVLILKRFAADRRLPLPAVADYDALIRALDAQAGPANRFYALRIDGRFARVKLRSVEKQTRPYRPFAEVIAGQHEYVRENIEGTLVGLRFPSWLGGVNAGGWHFHFVDRARSVGGHLLDLRSAPLVAQLDESRELRLLLPDDAAFDAADLGNGRDAKPMQRAIRPEASR